MESYLDQYEIATKLIFRIKIYLINKYSKEYLIKLNQLIE